MYETFGLRRTYRSYEDEIDNIFIIPLLKHSLIYDRGTGFFSVDALVNLANGIVPFLRNQGIIRIVTSVKLDEKEQELISQGYDIAEKTLLDSILKTIDEYLAKDTDTLNLDLITNLIAADRLKIKIAYLPNGGLYHEKIGFFKDEDGQLVYFSGSQNETYNGYKKNVESLSVLMSWEGESDLKAIEENQEYFDNLWNDKCDSISTLDFPEVAKNHLFQKYKKSKTVDDAITAIKNFNKKKSSGLRPYQEQAIEAFKNNKYCCFYEMATGTGKTFTAIKSIEELNKIENQLFVLILVPQIDLQTQWNEELEKQNIHSYLFGGEAPEDFETTKTKTLIDIYQNNNLVVALSVYDTYFERLHSAFTNLSCKKLIIIDEAHGLSKNQINKLPSNFEYRLGLSATPERSDAKEMQDILKYFLRGDKAPFPYTIEDAIRDGYLSNYEYHPIFVRLSDDEYSKYKSLSNSIRLEYEKEDIDEDLIKNLQIARSRIIKKATNKLIKLEEMLKSHKYNFINSVIYCGLGKDQQENKIIDSVTKLLNRVADLKVHQFTSEKTERATILKHFQQDYFDVLVAIKCLDQGVDIPKLDKIYIMASDTPKRQTIQRRGRVLRLCKESGKEIAYIYDMVVLPPNFDDKTSGKSLIINEFRRVKEYLRLAVNKSTYEQDIKDLEQIFNIKETDYEETK